MIAVLMSSSPNAMLVVTSPGMGCTSTSCPSGVTETMPSPMAPMATLPSASTARESNEYGVAATQRPPWRTAREPAAGADHTGLGQVPRPQATGMGLGHVDGPSVR